MTQKVVHRTLKARHTPCPPRRRISAPEGGFAGLLARLDDASARLDRARRSRRLR